MCPTCTPALAARLAAAHGGVTDAHRHDEADGGEGEPTSRRHTPGITVERKLSRQGNSLMLSVSPTFLHALHMFRGDWVTMTLRPESHEIVVRPTFRRTVGPPAPLTLKGVVEVTG